MFKSEFPVMPACSVLLTVLLGACGTGGSFYDFADADLKPPVLLSVKVPDARTLVFEFDEAVSPVEDAFRLSPPLGIEAMDAGTGDPLLRLSFGQDQEPGVEHLIEGAVEDEAGNSLTFAIPFFGRNDRLPAMVINEFITRGSGSHPDLVEILCSTGGNPAGACLFSGTPGEWESRFVFPAMEVSAGDFFLVHFRPQGIEEERTETDDPAASGGYDASAAAWDFWVKDGTGLPGNNGALTLAESPHGGILDAVLYSDRSTASDDRYRGFGSTSVLRMATSSPQQEHGPSQATGSPLKTRSAPKVPPEPDPSAGIPVPATPTDGTTGTSSLPRGATFGAVNSDAVYAP